MKTLMLISILTLGLVVSPNLEVFAKAKDNAVVNVTCVLEKKTKPRSSKRGKLECFDEAKRTVLKKNFSNILSKQFPKKLKKTLKKYAKKNKSKVSKKRSISLNSEKTDEQKIPTGTVDAKPRKFFVDPEDSPFHKYRNPKTVEPKSVEPKPTLAECVERQFGNNCNKPEFDPTHDLPEYWDTNWMDDICILIEEDDSIFEDGGIRLTPRIIIVPDGGIDSNGNIIIGCEVVFEI